jgi:hypothetical protein
VFNVNHTDYTPNKGDKLFFLPGVNVPRIKLKDLGLKYGIKTVQTPISDYNPNNLKVDLKAVENLTHVTQRCKFSLAESQKMLRPGVLGCFYSHYRLWQKCIDLNEPIFIFEDDGNKDGIAIGLDMFMHPEIDYKMIDPDNTNFSDYVTRSWNEDHIVKKIADLHVNDIAGVSPGNRLIDHMIHNGKILYITDLLLPEVHDTIIHEYSGAQLDWCYENELQMWSFFFDQKLFYEANPTKIAKYIYPSPKSPDMPDAAPGRTANFIGWQIIKAYMDRQPETTIKELINLTDSQLIMEKSKYKPKQKK